MRLILLSSKFYEMYGSYSEIMQKPSRPYACLEIMVNGVRFAIPFRHHIAHKYAFLTYDHCGLDYTKAVVISDESFIDPRKPQIEQCEFDALKGKEHRIYRGLLKYIELYKKAVAYRTNPHYKNILRYSTLKYFEDFIF